MDWQGFFFDPAQRWVERLERRARKRFPEAALAEAACTYAIGELSRDGWARLSGFEGRASPGTFLQSVFASLLEDYARRRFGRPRPPAWLKRLGSLWTTVWRLLCLERQEPEQIRAYFQREGTGSSQVDEAIRAIKARVPDCGARVGEVTVESLPDVAGEGDEGAPDGPDDRLGRGDLIEVLHAVALLLDPSAPGGHPPEGLAALSRHLEARLPELRARLASAISDDERLLLRLVFQQEVTPAEAARMLRLADHTARRMLRRAIGRLRAVLEAFGIGPEVLEGMQ